LLSNPYVEKELPVSELEKLDGPAMIDSDSLQLSVHNGSEWTVHELTIGLTLVKRRGAGDGSFYGDAKLVQAVGKIDQGLDAPAEKHSDVTTLYHVKGDSAPATTTVFRAPLDVVLAPDQEWHWAIVRAKGIPPQASAQVQQQTQTAPDTPVPAGTTSQPALQSQFSERPSSR
jgi:hypothetical protein